MNEVYNIIKLEKFKEYLNQNGVSHKILNNPRIYEILDMILDDFNVIDLNEESLAFIEKYLSIGKYGGRIKYMKDKQRTVIHKTDEGILLIRQQYDSKTSVIQMEKRYFYNNGIEYAYEVEKGTLNKQEFDKEINCIPTERISYSRDLDFLNLVIKLEKDKSVVVRKKYLIQEVPYMLQNLKLTSSDLQPIKTNGETIDDLCEVIAIDRKEYDMVKEIFSEKGMKMGQAEIFKTYQYFNRKYHKTDRYEDALAKQFNISQERV